MDCIDLNFHLSYLLYPHPRALLHDSRLAQICHMITKCQELRTQFVKALSYFSIVLRSSSLVALICRALAVLRRPAIVFCSDLAIPIMRAAKMRGLYEEVGMFIN